MRDVRRRIVSGFAANGIGQVLNVIIQLASLPLFLNSWGAPLYGEWLLLSTIPAYLAMSDLSLSTAAANEIGMQMAKGNERRALQAFQTAWCGSVLTSVLVVAAGIMAAACLPITEWLRLSATGHAGAVRILLVLCLQVLVTVQHGVLLAAYRGNLLYARASIISSVRRAAVFAATAAALIVGGDLFCVALASLCATVIVALATLLDLRRRVPWIILGYRNVTKDSIRTLLVPSLSFSLMPIAEALSVQGVLTILGLLLGPTAVVVFSSVRTLTRFVNQLTNMVGSTIWPELSRAIGGGDFELAKTIHRRAGRLAFWWSFFTCATLALVGRIIYDHWTTGKVEFDASLFALLLIVVLVNGLWTSSIVVQFSSNQTQRPAFSYFLSTVMALGLTFVLTPWMGLEGAALGLVLAEILMVLLVVSPSIQLVRDKPRSYFFYVLSPFARHP